MTQTNAIAALYAARHLANFSSFCGVSDYESLAVAALSSLSGFDSVLLQRAVPEDRREEFENAARAAAGIRCRLGA